MVRASVNNVGMRRKPKLVELPLESTSLEKQTRTDGLYNVITELGTSRDKRMYNNVRWETHTTEYFEQLYSGNEMASRIVNIVPEEALRRFVEWTNLDPKWDKLVSKKVSELDLRMTMLRSWYWGRAYGGGLTYIVTDTYDPASPLQIGENVIALRDLSRYDVRILTTDVETDYGSKNFGYPNIYYLTVSVGSIYKGYPIHWSRMVRWDGRTLPRRKFIQNGYWHDSILNMLKNAILNYESANDAAANILQDFNVGVFKMKNLANLISAGKESVVKKRMEMIAFSKSTIRAILLDADDESYEDVARAVEGLEGLLDKQGNRLVAATDMPHTKLLGESPDGSNATGNSTTQQWFDVVQSEQENYLKPKLDRLKEVIFYDMPELDYKFRSLYQLTELEQADMRLKQSQTDKNYVDMGALDPTEVTDSRFGGESYSTETELDEEGRESGLIGPGSAQAQNIFGAGGMNASANPMGSDPTDPLSQIQAQHDPVGHLANQANQPDQNTNPLQPKSDSEVPVVNQPNQPDPMSQIAGSNTAQAAAPSDVAQQQQDPMDWLMGQNRGIPQPTEQEEPMPKCLEPIDNTQGLEADLEATQFPLDNDVIESRNPTPKVDPYISTSISAPMRDPAQDPQMKTPGVPNQPRTIEPTVGNGIISPSGGNHKPGKPSRQK